MGEQFGVEGAVKAFVLPLGLRMIGAGVNIRSLLTGQLNEFVTERTWWINYLELIGNGKGYRVPPYQRVYSWSEEQWEDLWNDVLELRGRSDDRHYMGALVVEGASDREFLIMTGSSGWLRSAFLHWL